jgi:hypothetical protein
MSSELTRKGLFWASVLLTPVGFGIAYVLLSLMLSVSKEYTGFDLLFFELVFLLNLSVILYAFFYAPLRLYRRVDRTSIDGFCLALGLSVFLLCSAALKRLGLTIGGISFFIAVIAGVVVFRVLRPRLCRSGASSQDVPRTQT